MKDITIGQFYNVDSIIHRLDPRVKLWITFVYIVCLFLGRNPLMYALAGVVLLGYIATSKVPVGYIIKGMKPVVMVIAFAVLLNLFSVSGAKTVFHWHFITITDTGISTAIYLGLRLTLMIIGASMMTYTTTPLKLMDGLEEMFGWLKKFHVPVHELVMVMSIALRFIPILVGELDRIMKAQMSRGIDFKEGNLLVRLRKYIPILIPLFVSAIHRSEELAQAMDARCYHGGEGRTRMKPLKYCKFDGLAYVSLLVYIILVVVTIFIMK